MEPANKLQSERASIGAHLKEQIFLLLVRCWQFKQGYANGYLHNRVGERILATYHDSC